MKKIIPFIFILLSCNTLIAQEITNLILVGQKGVTEDLKEANAFILIKKYPEGSFERKDYIFHGPLKIMKTYSDSSLKILDGLFCSYRLDGSINLSGYYRNNKKESYWYHYNDTGKVIIVETFLSDSLIKSEIIIDSANKKKTELKEGEREAEFKGGNTALKKYLVKNLDADVSLKSVKGGTVRVGFKINTEGKVKDLFLQKSVEFVLDEELLRVISIMPDWIPAEQEGKKVNAYRVQPLTFTIQE